MRPISVERKVSGNCAGLGLSAHQFDILVPSDSLNNRNVESASELILTEF